MSHAFRGKVALITGAGSGTGRVTALTLSSQGATLALSDINATSLSQTAQLCHHNAPFHQPLDVSCAEACTSHLEATMARHGRLDHILDCAGVNPTSRLLQDTRDGYARRLLDVNVLGVFNVARAAIPHLRSGTSFVNVASIYGMRPAAHVAVYCATKYATVGFSKSIALELGHRGIRTNVVAPGFIDTPTNVGVWRARRRCGRWRSGRRWGRLGTAGEVADAIVFLFGDQARFVNGSVVEVNGGTG